MTISTPETLKDLIERVKEHRRRYTTSGIKFENEDVDIILEAATSAINLQERVKELEGAILSAENTLDAARKTFNFYVEEHRKKGSTYDKIRRNQDIRDLCDETLSNLAAVRKS